MKSRLIPALAAAAVLSGCRTMDESPSQMLGQATLRTANGASAGTVRLLENGSQATLSITLTGIAEGIYGVHLHTAGSCEPPDFTSAGPHLNPTNRQHGFDNPQGAHLGDLPNAVVGSSRVGTVSATLRGTPQEVVSQIFDADGTAVVVHAGADDYRTDPSGNSGNRLACGVLMRSLAVATPFRARNQLLRGTAA